MQPKLLLPLAAVAAVFAAPAAANATVTPTVVDATHLTLTGDGAADAIALGVDSRGFVTHTLNGATVPSTDFGTGPDKFKSDGTLSVTVNSAGGADTINL